MCSICPCVKVYKTKSEFSSYLNIFWKSLGKYVQGESGNPDSNLGHFLHMIILKYKKYSWVFPTLVVYVLATSFTHVDLFYYS